STKSTSELDIVPVGVVFPMEYCGSASPSDGAVGSSPAALNAPISLSGSVSSSDDSGLFLDTGQSVVVHSNDGVNCEVQSVVDTDNVQLSVSLHPFSSFPLFGLSTGQFTFFSLDHYDGIPFGDSFFVGKR